jgi:hypothetical protein
MSRIPPERSIPVDVFLRQMPDDEEDEDEDEGDGKEKEENGDDEEGNG